MVILLINHLTLRVYIVMNTLVWKLMKFFGSY